MCPQIDTTIGKVYPFYSNYCEGEGEEATKQGFTSPSLPFSGGWLGWLGYIIAWEIERLHLSLIATVLNFWYEPVFAVRPLAANSVASRQQSDPDGLLQSQLETSPPTSLLPYSPHLLPYSLPPPKLITKQLYAAPKSIFRLGISFRQIFPSSV